MTSAEPTDRSTFGAREGALAPYLRAIQAHRIVFVVVVLATVAAAAFWAATSTKEYSASAEILVTPLPQDNQSFLGFDLLRDSGDPTRTVQTAAALIETREAAIEAAKTLSDGRTDQQLLNSVSVQPEGESNVLDVTATADSPAAAARTANAFAVAALAIRRKALEKQVVTEIDRLESGGAVSPETERRISALNTLHEHGDPTLALAQRATPSNSPVGASAALVIALAVLAGLALGTGAAVVLELTARKIRDEEEAVQLYPLPILARVPVISRATRRKQAAGTWAMPPSIREPFRTLLTQIQREGDHHVVMFTSGSTGDGKTTSSINLAMTMALGGHSTILIDTDLRKPGIANALGISSGQATRGQLDGSTSIERSLVAVPGVEGLRVLSPTTAETEDEALIERFSEQLPSILEQASKLARFVVIDTPPLGEISDALRISPHIDEIVIVVYPGNTNRANFEIMRDLLDRSGDAPAGLLVIGDRTGASTTYYGYGMEQRRREMSQLAKPGDDRP